jgi:hypothetical protein
MSYTLESTYTQEELRQKIKHLEKSITRCYIRSGFAFCKNRERRVAYLRTFLREES